MEFRKIDYTKDLDLIIQLIQKNLDPNFTLEHFKWKHLENPFGKSYGLLALDEGKVIGLRMFMFWNFLNSEDGTKLRAIRPVDTVIDMEFRGQGLFTRLTLAGLEDCRSEYKFIFNTPNEKSLPGYLQMGWHKLDQVNYIRTALVNPLLKFVQFEHIKADSIDYKKSCRPSGTITTTHRTSDYFKWRYKGAKYKIACFNERQIYVAYGSRKFYIIVYEVFGNINNNNSVHKLLNSLAIKGRKPFIYYYQDICFQKLNLPIKFKRKKPVIVLKNAEELNYVEHINFSLADLEAVL